MRFKVPQLTLLFLTVLTVTVTSAHGQNQSAQTSQQQIQTWIQQLADADLTTRKTATQKLTESGPLAEAALKQALTSAGREQQLRINAILRRLSTGSFDRIRKTFCQSPTVPRATQIPGWQRFAEAVGQSEDDLQMFARLVNAAPQLFQAAFKSKSELRLKLESTASELLKAGSAGINLDKKFSVDRYVATLLLGSDNEVILRRATGSNLNELLTQPDFTKAVQADATGDRIKRVCGLWVLRSYITPVQPLEFCRQHQLPEGAELARRTLKSALRGRNGLHALMLLRDLKQQEDLPLVESLFDHPGVLFRGSATGRDYSATNGDLALCVAISLRGEDPRDFGVTSGSATETTFRFSFETIGFESDADRQSARQMYITRFLDESK